MTIVKGFLLRFWVTLGVIVLISASSLASIAIWDRYGESIKSKAKGYLQKVSHTTPAAQPIIPTQDTQVIQWQTIRTHLHVLQIAKIPLSPKGPPAIWALAEIGQNILFVSRLGHFGYLDSSNALHLLDLQTPMMLEDLRQSELFNDPVFELPQVRTLDLLSIQTGANVFDLYASYHRYKKGGKGCFELVVSRIRLETNAEGIRVVSSDWDDIYVVRPCIEIKETGMRFAGMEGGGRLVMVDPDTLLLSVGDYEFEGVNHPTIAAMDPESDLGKVIEISIPNHQGQIFAMGMRNPQGLLIARDGRIWETEHGPSGGDEVNLLRRDANYGWPIVTYGLQYGSPPSPWPHNAIQGQHKGYVRPQFAFVPSIGISNIIDPSDVEFPLWNEHLLVSSLAGQSLYAVKLENDAIVYSEPIKLGERLRDMISLHDGRIAIVTDSGKLLLLRNAEHQGATNDSFTVTGFSKLPPPYPFEAPDDSISPELHAIRVFHYHCASCHKMTGETLVGPPLNGLFDREIGKFPGYPYSKTLAEMSGKWTPELLRAYIEHSDPRFAGSAMPPVNMHDMYYKHLFYFLSQPQGMPASAAIPGK